VVYQSCIESLNSSVSSDAPVGRGASLVTRCCGKVPSTSEGMSSTV